METENESKKDKNKVLSLFEDMDAGFSEVKPLTKGLGFKDKVSEGVYTMEVDREINSDAGTLDIGHREMGDGVLNISDEGELRLQNTASAQPVLFHSGHDGLIKRSAKKSGESILGAFIDVLFISAFAILTTAAFMELGLYGFKLNGFINTELAMLAKLGVVFAAYFLSYKILTRILFGRTLGEWSSRHQLGLLSQQRRFYYPIQVLMREIVCLFTGVFALPIISTLANKDMGYYFSGLQTYMEQKQKK